jgi:hypothetical protein
VKKFAPLKIGACFIAVAVLIAIWVLFPPAYDITPDKRIAFNKQIATLFDLSKHDQRASFACCPRTGEKKTVKIDMEARKKQFSESAWVEYLAFVKLLKDSHLTKGNEHTGLSGWVLKDAYFQRLGQSVTAVFRVECVRRHFDLIGQVGVYELTLELQPESADKGTFQITDWEARDNISHEINPVFKKRDPEEVLRNISKSMKAN